MGLPSLVLGVLLVSWSFRQTPGPQAIHPVALLIAAGMLAALASVIVDIGMPGLQQPALLALLLLWLSIAVHGLARAPSPSGRR